MDPLARFEFSQSSLQDFADCPFRFYLRHIRRLAWPAMRAEPAREMERHMQRGQRFHRLAQQYLLGMPADKLTRLAEADEDEHLAGWWQNFLANIPVKLRGERAVEVYLSTPLPENNGVPPFSGVLPRLAAVLDLVVIAPEGKITIYDWKTALRRTPSAKLRGRMQTLVYPYLMVRAGADLNDRCPVLPEQVEMIYWFAAPDQSPETIPYARDCFERDEFQINSLVREIHRLNALPGAPVERFSRCDDMEGCKFCVYRSLCERGEAAGEVDEELPELDDVRLSDFQFEQIAEVPF